MTFLVVITFFTKKTVFFGGIQDMALVTPLISLFPLWFSKEDGMSNEQVYLNNWHTHSVGQGNFETKKLKTPIQTNQKMFETQQRTNQMFTLRWSKRLFV